MTDDQIRERVSSLTATAMESVLLLICDVVSRTGDDGDYEWSDAMEEIYEHITKAVQ